jgi:hypothetical protein
VLFFLGLGRVGIVDMSVKNSVAVLGLVLLVRGVTYTILSILAHSKKRMKLPQCVPMLTSLLTHSFFSDVLYIGTFLFLCLNQTSLGVFLFTTITHLTSHRAFVFMIQRFQLEALMLLALIKLVLDDGLNIVIKKELKGN